MTTQGIFSDACAQGPECDSALHFCSSQALKYCRVPLVAKGEENNSLAPLSLEDPVLDVAPSQELTSSATTATHQLCLSSKEHFGDNSLLFASAIS